MLRACTHPTSPIDAVDAEESAGPPGLPPVLRREEGSESK